MLARNGRLLVFIRALSVSADRPPLPNTTPQAMYAVTSCKTVDLYGFGHDTQLQGIASFSHYYKPDIISSLNTGHQVLSEHHILGALVEAKNSTQLRQRLSNLGVDGSLLTNLESVNDPDEHLDRGYTICSQLGGIC